MLIVVGKYNLMMICWQDDFHPWCNKFYLQVQTSIIENEGWFLNQNFWLRKIDYIIMFKSNSKFDKQINGNNLLISTLHSKLYSIKIIENKVVYDQTQCHQIHWRIQVCVLCIESERSLQILLLWRLERILSM